MVDVLTNIRNVFFFANQSLEDEQLKHYTGEERDRRRASYRAVVRLRCVQYLMDITMWVVFVGGRTARGCKASSAAGDFVMITAAHQLACCRPLHNWGRRIPEFYDQVGSARESIDTLIVARHRHRHRPTHPRWR